MTIQNRTLRGLTRSQDSSDALALICDRGGTAGPDFRRDQKKLDACRVLVEYTERLATAQPREADI
jgi:hypothetical protein